VVTEALLLVGAQLDPDSFQALCRFSALGHGQRSISERKRTFRFERIQSSRVSACSPAEAAPVSSVLVAVLEADRPQTVRALAMHLTNARHFTVLRNIILLTGGQQVGLCQRPAKCKRELRRHWRGRCFHTSGA
jgi:hypothetical protein